VSNFSYWVIGLLFEKMHKTDYIVHAPKNGVRFLLFIGDRILTSVGLLGYWVIM